MKAAVIQDINRVEVFDIPVPSFKKNHALIKIAYGGFCGPTELCIIEGIHPRAKFPLVFCHEFAGIIERVSPGSSFAVGDRVTVNPLISCGKCYICQQGDRYICENLNLIGIDCDGGFAQYCMVPEENLVRLPEGMSLKLAAFAEPIAVGVHAVRGSAFRMGDRALVIGAGPIGMIVAQTLRLASAGEVIIAERDERRLAFAKSLGFTVAADMGELKHANKVFDVVFDTTGAPPVLPYAVDLVKIKGFIAIVGKFDFPTPVNLHDVLFKELTIKGFRVYKENEFLHAVHILHDHADLFEKLITDEYDLDEINTAIEDFKSRKNLCKIMLKMGSYPDVY